MTNDLAHPPKFKIGGRSRLHAPWLVPSRGDGRVYPKALRPVPITPKLGKGPDGFLSAVVASKLGGMLPSNLGRGRFGLPAPLQEAGESETE